MLLVVLGSPRELRARLLELSPPRACADLRRGVAARASGVNPAVCLCSVAVRANLAARKERLMAEGAGMRASGPLLCS